MRLLAQPDPLAAVVPSLPSAISRGDVFDVEELLFRRYLFHISLPT
jgi:hypothetical protein